MDKSFVLYVAGWITGVGFRTSISLVECVAFISGLLKTAGLPVQIIVPDTPEAYMQEFGSLFPEKTAETKEE